MQVFAAIMKYDEFIRCGGWNGDIEKLEQDGAILVDGCLLAKHLCECFVLNRYSIASVNLQQTFLDLLKLAQA